MSDGSIGLLLRCVCCERPLPDGFRSPSALPRCEACRVGCVPNAKQCRQTQHLDNDPHLPIVTVERKVSREEVLATRRCPHCGGRLLSDPEEGLKCLNCSRVPFPLEPVVVDAMTTRARKRRGGKGKYS